MYDLANQSYTLLITTLFYGIYFKNIVVGDPARGEALWGQSFAIASLIVVAISPLLGALADFSGRKKLALNLLCLGCALPTIALGLTGPGTIALAMALNIFSNICFMSGENFLAAFLPEISNRKSMGRVSALGWTMGYVGAMLCLPLSLLIPGVAQQTASGFKWSFVFAGLWFLTMATPTFLFLKERKVAERLPPGSTYVTIGFRRLWETMQRIRRFREVAVFLSVFLVYSCGMQVIIVFSGIIAEQQFKPRPNAGIWLVAFVWLLALVAGLGSFVAGLFQDRIGHKRTLAASLLIWLATALGAAALPRTGPAELWHFSLVGAGVGLGLGMTGSASRALVGAMTPAHRTAEFFGQWGLAYKLAGAIGPAAYVAISSQFGMRGGMLLVAVSFAAGLVGLLFVRPERGQLAAEEEERRFAAEGGSVPRPPEETAS